MFDNAWYSDLKSIWPQLPAQPGQASWSYLQVGIENLLSQKTHKEPSSHRFLTASTHPEELTNSPFSWNMPSTKLSNG